MKRACDIGAGIETGELGGLDESVADRLAQLSPKLSWVLNIWMGVSVESEEYRSRIDALRRTGAESKFLSLEPLLGPLPDLNLADVGWVIVGGESGPKSRPVDAAWATELRD